MSSSPAVPKRATPLLDSPPVWMAAVIGVMVLLHVQLPLARWVEMPWRRLGWIPLALALPAMLHSLIRFVAVGTGLRPFKPATTLVATGAFRWTRNPMYLGMVVCLAGIAVLLGTVTPLLGPPLLFLVLDRHFVRREEVFLRANLGEPYELYCQRVRRWL
ncbi:MAG: isoprenylcysteine carboxylmethyltransferase family protein [Planctomycetes bacterium]|nr:isoprenylcysteine carboxylmethyltransferase family protein [Planctomycetota bacterium]